MTDVKGRTAFITGGANGIGLGIARSLAREGVKLALADVDVAGLARAKAELEAVTSVETYELDVRDRAAYQVVADAAEQALGPVSLVFNNAGVVSGAPSWKLTYDLWDWSLGINLNGVVNGVQTFLPRIVERGQGGHIVNTASGAGLVSTESGVLYTTAKFGVVGMSEALHHELKAIGIGVTVLCPGAVATDIIRRSASEVPSDGVELSAEQKQRLGDKLAEMTEMLKQGVTIDEVGEMVLKAVRGNAMHIHTDPKVADMIRARTKTLLDAFSALEAQ